jgi:hypothetical protein
LERRVQHPHGRDKQKHLGLRSAESGLTLEEQIENERERNDSLALEIQRVLAGIQTPIDGMSAGAAALWRTIEVSGLISELKRQKKESDERLASLRRPRAAADTTAPSSRSNRKVTGRDPEGNVARRRALVTNNPDVTAAELCGIFDRAEPPLLVLKSYGKKFWTDAYRTPGYKGKIDKMIATDRKWIREQR